MGLIRLPDFDALRDYVHSVLCGRANLCRSAVMAEATIVRRGRPCGIEYSVQAGKSAKLSAIWESDSDRILFYDQDLTRFSTVEISGPDPAAIPERTKEAGVLQSAFGGK